MSVIIIPNRVRGLSILQIISALDLKDIDVNIIFSVANSPGLDFTFS